MQRGYPRLVCGCLIVLFVPNVTSKTDIPWLPECTNSLKTVHNKTSSFPESAWPTLYLLGAQKCGTTSLASVLRRHSQVCSPSVPPNCPRWFAKEAHFWTNPHAFRVGVPHYLERFASSEECRAKRSKNLDVHGIDGTPAFGDRGYLERMVEYYPPEIMRRVKFIILLRDPIARDLSRFNHQLKNIESGEMARQYPSFSASQHASQPSTAAYEKWLTHLSPLDRGMYGPHLKYVLQHLRRSQVLILNFETLLQNTTETFLQIASFLNIEKGEVFDRHLLHENKARTGLSLNLEDLLPEQCNKLEHHYAASTEQLFELLTTFPGPPEEPPFPSFQHSQCGANNRDEASSRRLQLLLFDPVALASAQQWTNRWKFLKPQVEHLAAVLRQNGFVSVLNKSTIPASGDKRDFYSTVPYAWPCKERPHPCLNYGRREHDAETLSCRSESWIICDGQFNRKEIVRNDHSRFEEMAENVESLAMAYTIFRNDVYGELAAEQVRVWFVYNQTKMLPRLKYTQIIPHSDIPSRAAGSKDCVIDVYDMTKLLDGITLVQDFLSAEDLVALRKWMASFLEFISEKSIKTVHDRHFSNHGPWYDVVYMSIAKWLGRDDLVMAQSEFVKEKISRMVGEKGNLPHETGRAQSIYYMGYTLEAFAISAHLAAKVGVDTWRIPSKVGSTLEDSIAYIAPHVPYFKDWPHPNLGDFKLSHLELALRLASRDRVESKFDLLRLADMCSKEDQVSSLQFLVAPTVS